MSNAHTSLMPETGASNADHDSRYMPRHELAKTFAPIVHTHTFIQDADGDTGVYCETNPDEDIIRMLTAGVERVHISATGQVGIGLTPAGTDQLQVGTGANYSAFEQDGTLEFNGAATVWDDQQVSLFATGRGASFPTETAYKGGRVLAFDKGQDNQIFFNIQYSHKLRLGSTLEMHLHVAVPDNNAGVVRWIFTYSFADISDDFPAASTITVEQTIAANSLDEHLLFEIGDLADTAGSVSSIVICSLTREGTHLNDTYDNDLYLVALDSHFECDTVGSRTELAK